MLFLFSQLYIMFSRSSLFKMIFKLSTKRWFFLFVAAWDISWVNSSQFISYLKIQPSNLLISICSEFFVLKFAPVVKFVEFLLCFDTLLKSLSDTTLRYLLGFFWEYFIYCYKTVIIMKFSRCIHFECFFFVSDAKYDL